MADRFVTADMAVKCHFLNANTIVFLPQSPQLVFFYPSIGFTVVPSVIGDIASRCGLLEKQSQNKNKLSSCFRMHIAHTSVQLSTLTDLTDKNHFLKADCRLQISAPQTTSTFRFPTLAVQCFILHLARCLRFFSEGRASCGGGGSGPLCGSSRLTASWPRCGMPPSSWEWKKGRLCFLPDHCHTNTQLYVVFWSTLGGEHSLPNLHNNQRAGVGS